MSVETFSLVLLATLLATLACVCSDRKALGLGLGAAVIAAQQLLPATGFAIIGTIIELVLLSTPLYVVIGSLTLVCFYFGSSEYQSFADYQLLVEKVFTLTDKNVLLAIPFFVVAGALMTAGGIARRIIDFADALVGWLPGGMAAATVCSCLFFAAISGSSPVTVIAIGSIMMPALRERGHSEQFSLGLVTSAGSLGILIPPSIPMIIYAIVVTGAMRVDVADLFIAGLGPGALIGVLLIGYSVVAGIRRPGFQWSEVRPPSLINIARRFVDGFWALLLPVIVLGGIYPLFGPTGLFTPTEAAAVSAVYAFLVERFIHCELELRKLPGILAESALMMGGLLIIMILSFSLNHYFVEQQIPDAAVAWIDTLDLSRWAFLLILNVLLLLVGCLMDIISAVLVVAPLVAPVALGFGIDPVHLAIIFVVNLEIGYLTPPIGMNLFVSASLFQRPISLITRAVLPFTLLLLGGLAIVTWYEPVALGLVHWMSPDKAEEAAHVDNDTAVTPPSKSEGTASKAEPSDRMGENRDDPAEATDEATEAPVLSIEELMKQAADKPKDSEPEDVKAPSGPVKSIKELMQEAQNPG